MGHFIGSSQNKKKLEFPKNILGKSNTTEAVVKNKTIYFYTKS